VGHCLSGSGSRRIVRSSAPPFIGHRPCSHLVNAVRRQPPPAILSQLLPAQTFWGRVCLRWIFCGTTFAATSRPHAKTASACSTRYTWLCLARPSFQLASLIALRQQPESLRSHGIEHKQQYLGFFGCYVGSTYRYNVERDTFRVRHICVTATSGSCIKCPAIFTCSGVNRRRRPPSRPRAETHA